MIVTGNIELKHAIEVHQKMLVERAGLSELSVADELPSDLSEPVYEEKIQKTSFKLAVRRSK